MGKTMTRNEELNGLKVMYETLASVPEDKRFDFFLNNSPTFRKDVQPFLPIDNPEENLDRYISTEEMKLYQNYIALLSLRNLAAMMYPSYLKRAEYSARDMSYPLDVVIQG